MIWGSTSNSEALTFKPTQDVDLPLGRTRSQSGNERERVGVFYSLAPVLHASQYKYLLSCEIH